MLAASQESGVEDHEAIAHFRVQAARRCARVALRREARGRLPRPEAVHTARRRAPGWGEGQGEGPVPVAPGSMRSEPLAPHSW